MQLNAPAPRINSRIFFLVKAKGNNKDRFAYKLKVANRSFSVAQTSPARCVSEREKGGNFAPEDSKGRSPWRAFGDFPRDGKVTRGGGAERPLMGVWGPPAPTSGSRSQVWRLASEGRSPSRRSLRGGGAERPLMGVWGPPAPTSGSAEGQRPSRWSLRGGGAERPLMGVWGPLDPLRGAGAKSGDLLPRERSPSQEPLGEKGAQAPFSKTAAAPAAPAGRPPPPEQSG